MRNLHTIYASKASSSFSELEIPELLARARKANAACGVTGMLLYVEGNFFQVLEGEESAVSAIFERIRVDTRHTRVTQIIREPIFERHFAEWTMGFSTLELCDIKTHLGENDFFASASCLEQLTPGRATKLLAAFRNGRWRADQTGLHIVHRRVS
jgi:hypothetical protein